MPHGTPGTSCPPAANGCGRSVPWRRNAAGCWAPRTRHRTPAETRTSWKGRPPASGPSRPNLSSRSWPGAMSWTTATAAKSEAEERRRRRGKAAHGRRSVPPPTGGRAWPGLPARWRAARSRVESAQAEVGRLRESQAAGDERRQLAQSEFTALESQVAGVEDGEETLDAEYEDASCGAGRRSRRNRIPPERRARGRAGTRCTPGPAGCAPAGPEPQGRLRARPRVPGCPASSGRWRRR